MGRLGRAWVPDVVMWLIIADNYKSNIVNNLVHLYSFTCHLQAISHGTIAYITHLIRLSGKVNVS